MNKCLMAITVETLAFLELCGDTIVHRSVAMSQTQQVVAGLRQLTEAEKLIFISFVEAYAKKEQISGAPSRRVLFLQSLPGRIWEM